MPVDTNNHDGVNTGFSSKSLATVDGAPIPPPETQKAILAKEVQTKTQKVGDLLDQLGTTSTGEFLDSTDLAGSGYTELYQREENPRYAFMADQPGFYDIRTNTIKPKTRMQVTIGETGSPSLSFSINFVPDSSNRFNNLQEATATFLQKGMEGFETATKRYTTQMDMIYTKTVEETTFHSPDGTQLEFVSEYDHDGKLRAVYIRSSIDPAHPKALTHVETMEQVVETYMTALQQPQAGEPPPVQADLLSTANAWLTKTQTTIDKAFGITDLDLTERFTQINAEPKITIANAFTYPESEIARFGDARIAASDIALLYLLNHQTSTAIDTPEKVAFYEKHIYAIAEKYSLALARGLATENFIKLPTDNPTKKDWEDLRETVTEKVKNGMTGDGKNWAEVAHAFENLQSELARPIPNPDILLIMLDNINDLQHSGQDDAKGGGSMSDILSGLDLRAAIVFTIHNPNTFDEKEIAMLLDALPEKEKDTFTELFSLDPSLYENTDVLKKLLAGNMPQRTSIRMALSPHHKHISQPDTFSAVKKVFEIGTVITTGKEPAPPKALRESYFADLREHETTQPEYITRKLLKGQEAAEERKKDSVYVSSTPGSGYEMKGQLPPLKETNPLVERMNELYTRITGTTMEGLSTKLLREHPVEQSRRIAQVLTNAGIRTNEHQYIDGEKPTPIRYGTVRKNGKEITYALLYNHDDPTLSFGSVSVDGHPVRTVQGLIDVLGLPQIYATTSKEGD